MLAASEAGDILHKNSGVVGYLKHQALENPNGFMQLLGKVIPLQVEHSGERKIVHTTIELVPTKVKSTLKKDVDVIDVVPEPPLGLPKTAEEAISLRKQQEEREHED